MVDDEPLASAQPDKDWASRVDSYIDGVHEVTVFDVNLKVSVDNEEMQRIGSPIDWEWKSIVNSGVSSHERVTAEVRSVSIEQTSFVDHKGRIIMETTYSVADKAPGSIPESLDMVSIPKLDVEDMLAAFSEGVVWSPEQRDAYVKLADMIGHKPPEGVDAY